MGQLDVLRQMRTLIYEHCGVFVPDARLDVLAARLRPRLEACGCQDVGEYLDVVRYGQRGELDEAIGRVLNHETYFFRERAQLDAVVSLVRAGIQRPRFRILCAGCSTGEEAYSVSILLHRARLLSDEVAVEGIDVAASVIEHARSGRYEANSFRGDAHSYVDAYFTRCNGDLRIEPALASGVSFRQGNLLVGKDLGTAHYDAILCRNVLVYFAEDARRRALTVLQRALVPGGHLFLGHSESLRRATDEMEIVKVGEALAYRRPSLWGKEAEPAAGWTGGLVGNDARTGTRTPEPAE